VRIFFEFSNRKNKIEGVATPERSKVTGFYFDVGVAEHEYLGVIAFLLCPKVTWQPPNSDVAARQLERYAPAECTMCAHFKL
jgi:hypothetical protein